MKTGFVNSLINPSFAFWDYGNGDFTGSGVVASKWKLIKDGLSSDVAVRKGTFADLTTVDKWLRGKSCLEIDVNVLPTGTDNFTVRQIVSHGEKFGRQLMSLSGIVSGPKNAIIYVGFNNFFKKVVLKGIDVPVRFEHVQTIDDPPTVLSVDCLTKPSETGKYKVCFIQLEAIDANGIPSSFEVRNDGVERNLLNRYVYPVTNGMIFISSTVSAFGGVNFPVPMRKVPTYKPLITTGISLIDLISGSDVVSGVVGHTASNVTTKGARLSLTNGWSALTNGSVHMINTDTIGVFDADY